MDVLEVGRDHRGDRRWCSRDGYGDGNCMVTCEGSSDAMTSEDKGALVALRHCWDTILHTRYAPGSIYNQRDARLPEESHNRLFITASYRSRPDAESVYEYGRILHFRNPAQ